MRKLFLIRGLQGSGKTTLAHQLINTPTTVQMLADPDSEPTGFEVSADGFFTKNGEPYKFDPDRLVEAHLWCQKVCERAMKSGKYYTDLIVVHNTFSRQWELDPYLKMADENSYIVQILECHGSFKNVHDVPAEVIEKTRARWQHPVSTCLN